MENFQLAFERAELRTSIQHRPNSPRMHPLCCRLHFVRQIPVTYCDLALPFAILWKSQGVFISLCALLDRSACIAVDWGDARKIQNVRWQGDWHAQHFGGKKTCTRQIPYSTKRRRHKAQAR